MYLLVGCPSLWTATRQCCKPRSAWLDSSAPYQNRHPQSTSLWIEWARRKMEGLDVSHESLTLRAHDDIRTLPDRLQGQGLFAIAMVFLSCFFTSHQTSDSSLRRFPICQCVGRTFLEVCFVCVWIVCGTAPVARPPSHAMMEHRQVRSMSSQFRYRLILS